MFTEHRGRGGSVIARHFCFYSASVCLCGAWWCNPSADQVRVTRVTPAGLTSPHIKNDSQSGDTDYWLKAGIRSILSMDRHKPELMRMCDCVKARVGGTSARVPTNHSHVLFIGPSDCDWTLWLCVSRSAGMLKIINAFFQAAVTWPIPKKCWPIRVSDVYAKTRWTPTSASPPSEPEQQLRLHTFGSYFDFLILIQVPGRVTRLTVFDLFLRLSVFLRKTVSQARFIIREVGTVKSQQLLHIFTFQLHKIIPDTFTIKAAWAARSSLCSLRCAPAGEPSHLQSDPSFSLHIFNTRSQPCLSQQPCARRHSVRTSAGHLKTGNQHRAKPFQLKSSWSLPKFDLLSSSF